MQHTNNFNLMNEVFFYWHKHCFQFLVRHTVIPREMENNSYAKLCFGGREGGSNEVYYGRCGNCEYLRNFGKPIIRSPTLYDNRVVNNNKQKKY